MLENKKTRFDYFDGRRTIIAMCEGNPGAANAMMDMLAVSNGHGPEGQRAWEMVKICDELGIYGSRLYQLWNDCLDRDPVKMADCAAGYRAGKITAAFILEQIRGDDCRGFRFEPREVDCG